MKRKASASVSYKEDKSLPLCPTCEHLLTSEDAVGSDTPLGLPPPKEKEAKKARTVIVGRSQGAPPMDDWSTFKNRDDLRYFPRLDGPIWTGLRSDHVRLAFQRLDKDNPHLQGLAMPLREISTSRPLREHFDAVLEAMIDNKTGTSCTEAVGEAAAAMAMVSRCRGFEMESGFAPGAGIDQIWTQRTNGSLSEVIIVEAKGPGATESKNRFMPPDFEQMEPNWIVHNLATMMQAAKARGTNDDADGLLSASIVRGSGLKVGKVYPGYGGASKVYYGPISFDRTRKIITLRRVTVQARWNADSTLAWTFTEKDEIDSFVAFKKEQKYDSARRLTVGADAQEITYP